MCRGTDPGRKRILGPDSYSVVKAIILEMRSFHLAVVFTLLVGACSGSSEPTSTTFPATPQAPISATTITSTITLPTPTTRPLVAPSEMVAEVRPITLAELNRLDDDENAGILDCENEGGFHWDYFAINEDSRRGRQANDALADALVDINEDAERDGYQPLPLTGWTALTDGAHVQFVLIEEGRWLAYVSVGGAPDLGVWRNNSAVVCPRDPA